MTLRKLIEVSSDSYMLIFNKHFEIVGYYENKCFYSNEDGRSPEQFKIQSIQAVGISKLCVVVEG